MMMDWNFAYDVLYCMFTLMALEMIIDNTVRCEGLCMAYFSLPTATS